MQSVKSFSLELYILTSTRLLPSRATAGRAVGREAKTLKLFKRGLLLSGIGLMALGCSNATEPEELAEVSSAIWNPNHDVQYDADTPTHNAVVNVVGCTGTLVAPDLVLTAGHCEIHRARPTLSPGTKIVGPDWESPNSWYDLRDPVTVSFGVDGSGQGTRIAHKYSIPGENDAILLKLDYAAPSNIVPARVATRLPLSASQFFPGKKLEMVGFGGTGELISIDDTAGRVSDLPTCISTQPGHELCLSFSRAGWSSSPPARLNEARFDGVRWSVTTLSLPLPSGRISCASWGKDRVDCFYKNTSNEVTHIWSADDGVTFNGQDHFADPIASDPECISSAEGRLDCFARSTSNQLFHRWWWGGWGSEIVPQSPTFVGKPSCTAKEKYDVDCLMRGSDNKILNAWGNVGTPVYFRKLQYSTATDLECLSASTGQIDCFFRGINDWLQQIKYDGDWHNWNVESQVTTKDRVTSLSCTSSGPGLIDCFAGFRPPGSTPTIDWDWKHTLIQGSTWRPWEYIGTGPATPAECISWGPGRLDCFGKSAATDSLAQQYFDPSYGWGEGVHATLRLVAGATFSRMRESNYMTVSGVNQAHTQHGDSGGPLIYTDSRGERWVVGELQGGGYTATFGPSFPKQNNIWQVNSNGDLVKTDQMGTVTVGSMSTWLERMLPSGQTGTPQ